MLHRKQEPPKHLLAAGLGAGLATAALIALRYAIRPPTRSRVPDSISPTHFKTRAYQTSRGEIVYHEAGKGQPLIFVHSVGVGASSYEWSKVYPALAEKYRVLAIDLVGFGESQRPARSATPEDHAVAIADFIRAVCWGERPILIGSGLGAGFCVLTASQHPDLVQRVVLLLPMGLSAASGRGELPFGLSLASRIPLINRFMYRNYLSGKLTIRAWIERYGFAEPGAVTNEVVDIYATCAQQFGAEHAIFSFLRGRFRLDFERRLVELPHPVTLIWGDTSAASAERARKLSERIRLCRLEFLKGTRLLAALEASKELIELLREDLKSEIRVLKVG